MLRAAIERGRASARQELRGASASTEALPGADTAGDEEVVALVPAHAPLPVTEALGAVEEAAVAEPDGAAVVLAAVPAGGVASPLWEDAAARLGFVEREATPEPPSDPEDLGGALEQPGVPDKLVWEAEAEAVEWQGLADVGHSIERALSHALALHRGEGLKAFRVSSLWARLAVLCGPRAYSRLFGLLVVLSLGRVSGNRRAARPPVWPTRTLMFMGFWGRRAR